jgi:hypothetical protein
VIDDKLSRSCRRHEIEAAPDGQKVLSWLLRKHFEQYLGRFALEGLYVEGNPKAPRAFFHGAAGKVTRLVYRTRDGAEASRNVVMQRWGGRRPWFKNEGFGYRTLILGGVWGVAIEPFYIFTGADAKKPLPYAAQIERSARWNGRDARIGATHLTFWEDFLTRGAPLADLHQEQLDNLSLGRSLLQLPARIVV